jgi:hypothetical protein
VNFIELCECRLPLNRKERYYTGTVFPALVCSENFKYFDLFLKLLNHGGEPFDVSTDNVNIQFFTEYGLTESLFADKELFKEFFPDTPGTRDTPDILILINGPKPLLIAIEAKLYESFFKNQLVNQMNRQEKGVLVHLRKKWPKLRVVHAALLPKWIAEAKNFGDLPPAPGLDDPRPVITWEGIHAAFEEIASAQYFLEVLKAAISKNLTADRTGNAEDRMTGEDISIHFRDDTWPFHTMGRQSGLRGVLTDIKGGDWKKREYEVSSSLIPANRNWFLISTFNELVDHMEGAPSRSA